MLVKYVILSHNLNPVITNNNHRFRGVRYNRVCNVLFVPNVIVITELNYLLIWKMFFFSQILMIWVKNVSSPRQTSEYLLEYSTEKKVFLLLKILTFFRFIPVRCVVWQISFFFFNVFFCLFVNTVKPVYNDHHRYLKFVVVVVRWSLLRGRFM